ncbi:hypothetical protein G9A89_015336 [Geosiphon pyriformis]|nr:hypothetical protein G9A89_015336 [Geosiphon pyriformis]
MPSNLTTLAENSNAVMRNTSGNCKDSLREDPRQWVDFSSASEKKYINTHNNQELKNNLHHNIKKKAFSIIKETKVVTKTPNLTVLEFCHAIYTQNQSDLGLPEEYCPAESALTYYINARINYHIGKEEKPHDAKLGLYRELSQYTTKEVAIIAATIQYANKNFPISTGNTREHANKTKENSKTNQKNNQQKLKTFAQTPKKTIQILLGAASSSTSTPQMPRTPNIPITGEYSSLFQNPLFQPKFVTEFENCEEEFELESKKKTSKKTITRLVIETSSQFRNQKTCDQEEKPDIKEATFRNAQGNIIPSFLRPISPPAENGNEMATPYIARLTDFSGEEEETDMYTLETKPTSFAEFKNALLEYFSDPNTIIQLQNKFNTIKQNTGETVTQYLARFNQICHQIKAIEQEYYTNPQVLNQFIRRLKSSILGRVHPVHPNSLPEAITLARALKLAEKEANHSQMVNMVIEKNKTETLEKRVTQLGKELSKKIESYLILDPRKNTYQPPQRCSQEKPVHANTMPISHHVLKSRSLPATAHDSQPELTSQGPKSAHVEPERIGPKESKLHQNQSANQSKLPKLSTNLS